MPLIYAGIDEAGYGPLLGPLCVGMSVFEVRDWTDGDQAPNLWETLSGAVCREASDKRRRIAIDDSKKLKLSNSSATKHPLTHLERGVGTFMVCRGEDESCPIDDAAFFAAAGVKLPEETWYVGDAIGFPCGSSADQVAIASNLLRRELHERGVALRSLNCEAIGEGVFNQLVEAAGTKAAATESALVGHLWRIWDQWGAIGAQPGSGVRVICDRQGGRAHYTDMLSRAFPGVSVTETHQSATQSRYELRGKGDDGIERHMHVLFLVESEQHHLPVALASMLAKLTREMLMARFNRYWRGRYPELKPTAGYRGDGWRWMQDAARIFVNGEREALIRRA